MKKIFLTIIFSFIVSFFCVCIKNEFACVLYRNANYGMENLVKNGNIENLFVGSSMFRQGLDIDCIEASFGNSSFILAYNGNQPVFEYLELKYLLENGVNIKTLFLDMYAYSAAAAPKVSDVRLFLHTNFKFKKDVWEMLRKCDESTISLFWELFVTSNNETLLTYPINYRLTNRFYRKGGNIQKNKGTTVQSLVNTKIPVCETDSMNIWQRNALKQIILLCRENNIQLIMLETPKYYDVCEDENYQSLMQEYLSILYEEKIEYILSNDTAKYFDDINTVINFDSRNPELFLDHVHLSSKGRLDYSRQIRNLNK